MLSNKVWAEYPQQKRHEHQYLFYHHPAVYTPTNQYDVKDNHEGQRTGAATPPGRSKRPRPNQVHGNVAGRCKRSLEHS